MGANTNLNLSRAEVEVLPEVKSQDWAFGVFPYCWVAPAAPRAVQNAVGKASRAAYESSGADFLLQPRTKATYYNFVLFDYAIAEAQGKGARVK